MIVKMSKLEIIGPRELLLDVLAVIREQGVLHPEPEAHVFLAPEQRAVVHELMPDKNSAEEQLFLESMYSLTSEILELLPRVETRESRLDPSPILDTLAACAEKHLEQCRNWTEQRENMLREREEHERYALLLGTMGEMIGGHEGVEGLDFIGITLRDPSFVDRLRDLLAQLTEGEFTLTSALAPDGTLIGLIATSPAHSSHIKQILSDEQLPELPFPPALADLPLPERIRRVQHSIAAATQKIRDINSELESFARRWSPIYRRIDQWLEERLALLSAATVVQETDMCFVILGWARTDSLAPLAHVMTEHFDGSVVLEELQIKEQDLEQVPVVLRNPPYFRPFELFSRLLPLPRYASWDPTPFIGVFFPLFFGMMTGDAGYGLVLLAAALLVLYRKPAGMLADAARILLISSCFAILFGILFGEFFGEAGGRLLHLKTYLPERSHAVIPMLIFSIALGISHVVLGLVIGLISALRRHKQRKAAANIVTIGLIICLAALLTSLIHPSSWLHRRPVLVLAGLLIPLLILSGGLLAPLEFIKQIGNIVSYTRIMAIGLSSVLLANAANNLAGLTGDVILGTLAAIVLHTVAIILGTFAPTIHALRLHYVEFLSKFVEHGGKRFAPLHK
ncbi:MAG: hypothetical protein M0023_07545 [Desulfobacteraceae bacterium]|nr:hypothetical protein [Desulfobacteraceae bacterium]